ncbi:hypothetical protein PR048_018105, partial [Dryococelus australis]
MSKSGKSILVQGEPFYNFESCEPLFPKRIPDVVRGVRIKDAEINDVRTLLTLHFEEKWETIPSSHFILKCFNNRLQLMFQPQQGMIMMI